MVLIFFVFRNLTFLSAVGNVYIADEVNRRVRKLTESTGIISTIVGGGTGSLGDGGAATSATLSYLFCVSLDSVGRIIF
jgi:hypothetical protein